MGKWACKMVRDFDLGTGREEDMMGMGNNHVPPSQSALGIDCNTGKMSPKS